MVALYVLGYLLIGMAFCCIVWAITVLAARERDEDDPEPEKNMELFAWVLFVWPVVIPLFLFLLTIGFLIFSTMQIAVWIMNKFSNEG